MDTEDLVLQVVTHRRVLVENDDLYERFMTSKQREKNLLQRPDCILNELAKDPYYCDHFLLDEELVIDDGEPCKESTPVKGTQTIFLKRMRERMETLGAMDISFTNLKLKFLCYKDGFLSARNSSCDAWKIYHHGIVNMPLPGNLANPDPSRRFLEEFLPEMECWKIVQSCNAEILRIFFTTMAKAAASEHVELTADEDTFAATLRQYAGKYAEKYVIDGHINRLAILLEGVISQFFECMMEITNEETCKIIRLTHSKNRQIFSDPQARPWTNCSAAMRGLEIKTNLPRDLPPAYANVKLNLWLLIASGVFRSVGSFLVNLLQNTKEAGDSLPLLRRCCRGSICTMTRSDAMYFAIVNSKISADDTSLTLWFRLGNDCDFVMNRDIPDVRAAKKEADLPYSLPLAWRSNKHVF